MVTDKKDIVSAMIASWMKENNFDHISLEIDALALMRVTHARYSQGEVEEQFVSAPSDLIYEIGQMRESQVLPDRGGWTWARLWMDASDWVLHSEFDWMREPHFDPPFEYIPADCAAEVDLRPRSAEWIPDWMADGIARQEKHLGALARRRERDRARRAAKKAAKETQQADQAQQAEPPADQAGDATAGQTPPAP